MNAPLDIAASLAVSLGQSAAGLVAAYLHGSEADGRGHRESDVDVGVLLDRVAYPTRESRFEARLRLIHQLGVAMGREVDVLVLNDVPPQLARRVLTQGRQVFLQGPEEHHAFLRTTLSACRGPRAVSAAHAPGQARRPCKMTYLVERLAELRRHLDHLGARGRA